MHCICSEICSYHCTVCDIWILRLRPLVQVYHLPQSWSRDQSRPVQSGLGLDLGSLGLSLGFTSVCFGLDLGLDQDRDKDRICIWKAWFWSWC